MSGTAWMFVWLMLGLKIPIAALLWLVWWASHKDVEPETGSGGERRPHPHPHPPLPRLPRRGPHGGAVPLPPARVRHARALRGRRLPTS